MVWPGNPTIYEINTVPWLHALGQQAERSVTLADVADETWDEVCRPGIDAVWLMGVWERSPESARAAMGDESLLNDFERALPDWTAEDNIGSAYAIRRYKADRLVGGRQGVAAARASLAERGVRLMLDFVPNHVARDHPWAEKHSEYFVGGTAEDAARDPRSFASIGEHVIACGRDPFFPAWHDVLQLNAFAPDLRAAAIATVADIAGQCDGIRCDMAMLLINDIFEQTWGERAGPRPATDYWTDVISATKRAYPDFVFAAEAYWDREWTLQQLGFDFCYDKRFYDRLEAYDAAGVRGHLSGALEFHRRLVRFIENHDEPRSAATLGECVRAGAVAAFTLPGARLLYEGQYEGRKVRLPVFLRRARPEPDDPDLRAFYHRLIAVTASPAMSFGSWRLCDVATWPDNRTGDRILAWTWESPGEQLLISVNWAASPSQGRVRLPWDDLRGRMVQFNDLMSGQSFERPGSELAADGLFVDLGPWAFHVLRTAARPV